MDGCEVDGEVSDGGVSAGVVVVPGVVAPEVSPVAPPVAPSAVLPLVSPVLPLVPVVVAPALLSRFASRLLHAAINAKAAHREMRIFAFMGCSVELLAGNRTVCARNRPDSQCPDPIYRADV